MKDPIQKYFDVGTIQWMTYPPQTYPVSEALKKMPATTISELLRLRILKIWRPGDR